MNFDKWFETVPHAAQTQVEIDFMREEYRYVWDAAITKAIDECQRLLAQGKDDHSDSWMGNAIAAIVRLSALDAAPEGEKK